MADYKEIERHGRIYTDSETDYTQILRHDWLYTASEMWQIIYRISWKYSDVTVLQSVIIKHC